MAVYHREVIHVNEARCLKCKEVVRSMGGHHMAGCKCGNLHVDGGRRYLRRSIRDGKDSWEELSEVEMVEREPYDWEVESDAKTSDESRD
jgi:hypothetical protein